MFYRTRSCVNEEVRWLVLTVFVYLVELAWYNTCILRSGLYWIQYCEI